MVGLANPLDESNTDVERGNNARDLNDIRPPSYIFLLTISNLTVLFKFPGLFDAEVDTK